MTRTVASLFALCVASFAFAAESSLSLADLRMAKRFALGMSAGGPLSVIGLEIDINATEQLSIGGGVGTGVDFSTSMLKVRYFLLGRWASPYLAVGAAHWTSSGSGAGSSNYAPLAQRFFADGTDLSKGFSAFFLYPALGVQFLHPMGVSFFAEIQQMFKLFDFRTATYAGLGMHWYF